MSLLIVILALWGIGKAISAAQERKRQEQIARIKREQQRQREEAARMREDFRREQAEAKERAKRQAEIERETVRLAKEQAKQAAQLARHEEQINKLYERVDKCKDDIAHFSELAEKYTAQRDAAQRQLDELRDRLNVANGGLDPEQIAHGDMSKWDETSDMGEYMEKWSKAFDDKKSGKSKTSDIDKMQKQAEQLESKIIRLNNNIYSAEQKVKKAKADKYRAEAALSA